MSTVSSLSTVSTLTSRRDKAMEVIRKVVTETVEAQKEHMQRTADHIMSAAVNALAADDERKPRRSCMKHLRPYTRGRNMRTNS